MRRVRRQAGEELVRVLHVGAGSLYGGIESMLLTLARNAGNVGELDQRFALCFEGRLSRELLRAGAPLEALGQVRFTRPWTGQRARARLVSIVERQRIDAVICHGAWTQVLFGRAARASGARLVAWVHAPPTRLRLFDLLATRTSPDLVISNSRYTATAARRLFPRARSSIIYCPVEPPAVPDRLAWRASLRAELGAAKDRVVIVAACRLERWKGLHVLVDALGRLCGDSRWECWIAGGAQRPLEQQYLRELEALASRLGVRRRIRFLGQRQDIQRVLAAADVYCQPNVVPEPFGIAFVEALHAGLPVVTSAMGGAAEILDERCALFAPPRAADLAQRLGALITDAGLRSRLGACGPARARELCDPTTVIRELASSLHAQRDGH